MLGLKHVPQGRYLIFSDRRLVLTRESTILTE